MSDTPKHQETADGGCPPATCSPSLYLALALRDVGSQNEADPATWTNAAFALAPHCEGHEDVTEAALRIVSEAYRRGIQTPPNALMVRLYNQGYHAGHEDTVEACFVPIHHTDMDTYHADVVTEILEENAEVRRGGETYRLKSDKP